MASDTQTWSHGRRLFELLDEHQEPFLLEVYLLENGYSCRVLKSHSSMKCWPIDTWKELLGFKTHGFKRRRCVGVLSCVLHKLVHWKLLRKARNWDGRVPAIGGKKLLSCFHGEQLNGKRHWKRMQEIKQLSPVSVLELHSDEVCSYHNLLEEESHSMSSLNSEMSEGSPLNSASFSNPCKNTEGRRVLPQSKQLLQQCENELEILGQGELFYFKKQTADVAKIANLMEVELCNSKREWNHYQGEKGEIGMEIEGFIFEEIREEVVVEMLGSCCILDRC